MAVIAAALVLIAGAASVGTAAAAAADPKPPIAETGGVLNLAENRVTLGALLTPGSAPTTYYFEYGTTTAYGLRTASTTVDPSNTRRAVYTNVAGLTQGTTFHFRLVATSSAGTDRGVDVTFTTIGKPLITSLPPDGVTGNTATVGATINPRGSATTYRFQWGRTSKLGRYTPRRPLAQSGTTGVLVVEQLPNIKPNRKYYFRATATNAAGTSYGKLRSFKTPRTISGITARLIEDDVEWGGTGRLTGSIGGDGVKGLKVKIMRWDFPFGGAPWQTGTATANSAGNWSFKVGPLYSTTRFYAVTESAVPLASNIVEAGGAFKTKLRVDKRRSTKMRLRGLIYPATDTARVSIQRQSKSGRWIRVRRKNVSASSKYRMGFRTWVPRLKSRTAIYRFVVLPNDDGQHVLTHSWTVAVPPRS